MREGGEGRGRKRRVEEGVGKGLVEVKRCGCMWEGEGGLQYRRKGV